MLSDSRIIVALDYPVAEQAIEIVERLDAERCRLKVGKELFTSAGPEFVKQLVARNFDVFLDLKFHDIPNTVANACKAAAGLGVWMLNVHALGGREMMQAAREAIDNCKHKPLLIGVTILTSMGSEDLAETGLHGEPGDNVARLARLAQQAGLDGVVCSPQEVVMLRTVLGADFKLVTPGIRPAGSDKGDQKRIMTPADAIQAGSDYLVIGRPVTQADDPMQALAEIEAQMSIN